MNLRLTRVPNLIDINALSELNAVGVHHDQLVVGATTRQSRLEKNGAIAEAVPLLARAVPFIAHASIRNRGTIGGSLAHADPSAELPLVLSTLGGAVRLRSSEGDRIVSAGQFYQSLLVTAIRPTELLVEALFPRAALGDRFGFAEFARRPGDFAIVAAACALRFEGKSVASARIGLAGVADTPILVEEAAPVIVGTSLLERDIERAAQAARNAIDPSSDIHASREYRRDLAAETVRRAIRQAAGG
jgi:CO/xanthine dehydrogenase FAD-binding subunit